MLRSVIFCVIITQKITVREFTLKITLTIITAMTVSVVNVHFLLK